MKDSATMIRRQALNLLDHDHRKYPEGDPYGLILTGGRRNRLVGTKICHGAKGHFLRGPRND